MLSFPFKCPEGQDRKKKKNKQQVLTPFSLFLILTVEEGTRREEQREVEAAVFCYCSHLFYKANIWK